PLRVVAVTANRALDVADEAHEPSFEIERSVSQLRRPRLSGEARWPASSSVIGSPSTSTTGWARPESSPRTSRSRPRADFYTAAHPVAADVLLLIEVADSSLTVDRRVRTPLYARAAIPEAWILDLTADRVDVYRVPTADAYQQVVTFERGQRVAPVAFADLTVTVEDLLGCLIRARCPRWRGRRPVERGAN